ncbi:MAG TPA: acetyl-coenzyme A synthetase N-terminal domain-containing protein, partial [Hyphomicrobiales bacterium]|nr:acetyl-coenzyme A synthetase N-terminal domain-containing protein [Hyphomicrobiales bacterium]
MSKVKVHPVTKAWAKNAYLDNAAYEEMYAESVKKPAKFWGKQGKRID